jgi:hypothetical protein
MVSPPSQVDADLTRAEGVLDLLPRLLQTNPFLFEARANARARLGDWSGAARDFLEAEAEFRGTGDAIRATAAAADAALALYGDGDGDGAFQKMAQV